MSRRPRGSARELGPRDFADLFGTTVEDLPREGVNFIHKHNFGYRELHGPERDSVIVSILKRINSEDLTIAGDEGAHARWEKGWSENLASLSGGKSGSRSLVPRYMRPNRPLRLNQRLVMPADSRFEVNWYRVFSDWLFRKYLGEVDAIYEFGCGSGINVATLGRLFPGKKIVGLDWAVSSKKIVDTLARTEGWNVEGKVFDFFKPDGRLKMAENSAVLTIGALEQTGRRYERFLQYVLASSPALCINVEPICEWYDESQLVDHTAILFHRRRGYWEGFPDRLKQLESDGRVVILKMKRSYFGSTFIEGYSQTIWRPSGRR